MNTSNKNTLSYIPELDGMRGFAILLVMNFHAETTYFQGGFIGVDLFFVLSGFLITSLIINEYDSSSSLNLKNFYMRRLLRLGPALFLLLLVFSLLSIIFLSTDKARSNLVDTIISLFYLSNWARAFSIHPPDYLGHTWSLSIEEQFYILWPIALLTMLRTFKNRWAIAILAFVLAGSSWLLRIYLIHYGASYERLYNGLDTRADALMIGSLLGIILSSNLLSDRTKNILSKWLEFFSYFAVLALITITVNLVWTNPQLYYWVFFIVEILTATLIFNLIINKNSVLHKVLSMKWIVWVGSISYGLYLWHYPIYKTMQNLQYSPIEVLVYGSLATFMVSAGSFYILEKPILKWKNRYSGSSKVNKIN